MKEENSVDKNDFDTNVIDVKSTSSKDKVLVGDSTLDAEGWEEVKDIFFMLKLPIDVEIDFDRFSTIMSKRRRKIGLCGLRGSAPSSVQFRTGFVTLSENVHEIN